MRKETICISERALMFSIGGQLFEQAPNRQPRKAEIIMAKVKDSFRKIAYNDNEYYTYNIEKFELKKFIKDLLFAIPEFKDLNLSQSEYEKNIAVDDENRPKYSFSSRYDKYSGESWRDDFIDLDAFVQNVVRNLYMVMNNDIDCFCCVYSNDKNSDECNTCTINAKYKINYECGRNPRGKYTFACKYNCYKNHYICCEECDEIGVCTQKCNSSSNKCELSMNHKQKEENNNDSRCKLPPMHTFERLKDIETEYQPIKGKLIIKDEIPQEEEE